MRSLPKKIMGSLMALFLIMLVFITGEGLAKQPESSYWFPEDLLEWGADQDADAPYNRSSIPLADRKVANESAKVVSLSALNASTSGVPSQGSDDSFINTFSYWQYVDTMVYWAGSAGEGIIVPPSGDVIDAAHKNGVPILGNVFFPPLVYGGQQQWVDQMLDQKEDGSFPAADKLLEVSEYYGFDGWFINHETEGGTEKDAQKMQEFLIYLQENKDEKSEIMWYDSMVENGSINWQNYLTSKNKMFLQDGDTRVSDSMFLNFWWWNESQERSKILAEQLNRSSYDLYAGIDVEAIGTETNVMWDHIFPENKDPYTSLGIYRPDWAFNKAESLSDFYEKEKEFWIKKNDNLKDESNWPGISTYIEPNIAVTELPFTTHFNTGSGEFFNINGQNVSQDSWNNRSLQDVLPTWRGENYEGVDSLHVDFDWTDSYYGGSSLRITGELTEESPAEIGLYKTDLKIEGNTFIQVAHQQTGEVDLQVGVRFGDDVEYFDLTEKGREEWKITEINLSKYKNKKIDSLYIRAESSIDIDDFQMNIGKIALGSKNDFNKPPSPPEQVQINDISFENGIKSDIRLSWEPVEDLIYYEIYEVLEHGDEKLLGVTPNHYYFIGDFKRNGRNEKTNLKIYTVNESYSKSKKGSSVEIDWPDYPKPIASFETNEAVIYPGQTIQFTNTSSEVTESVEWLFEGGTPRESTELHPQVKYEVEGIYPVQLKAINSEGEDIVLKESFITVIEGARDINNVSLGKNTTASGQCAPNEGPENAVNGMDDSKWCALGSDQWIEIDLGQVYSLSNITIKHAETGGEPAAFNTKSFTIETSIDSENWHKIINVENQNEAISKHAIPLEEARYVRLNIDSPTQGGDQAARIYEIEVYGF